MNSRYSSIILVSLFAVLLPLTMSGASRGFDMSLYYKWNDMQADSLIHLGRHYLNENKADSAVMCLSVVAGKRYSKYFDKQKAQDVCRALNNIGYIYYYRFHDYVRSLEYLSQARSLAEKYDLVNLLPHISLTQSYIYMAEAILRLNFNDTKEMLQKLKIAYGDAIRAHEDEIAVSELNSMLNIAFTNDLMEEIKSEISSFESANYPSTLPEVNVAKTQLQGIKLFRNGDYEGAIEAFKSMLQPDNPDSSNDLQLLQAYDDIAYVCKSQRKYTEAESLYNKIVEIAKRNNSPDIEASAYVSLCDLMQLRGNTKAANEYLLRFYATRDSILYSADRSTFDEVKFFDEYQKVQMEVQTVEAKRKKQKIVIVVISIIGAVCLIFLIILFYAYKSLRRKNKILYDSTLKFINMEDERKKLHREDKKYSYNPIPDDRKDEIMQRIIEVMDTTQEIYTEDFSLNRLAELVNAKYRQVSQVINEKLGKNFHQLLSEYRVNEACRRLRDHDNYGNLTVEAIAASVGIRSRSNFSVTFKKITGLSPSEYQKLSK